MPPEFPPESDDWNAGETRSHRHPRSNNIRPRIAFTFRSHKPFPQTSISSYPTTDIFTMLRFTVLAARPLGLGKSTAVTLRPVARNFGSFGPKTTTNHFSAASNRSRVSPSFWSKFSRTFMTDSAAVATRPTQAEAWKRYAVTAVSPESDPEGFRSIQQIRTLGYCRWNSRRYQRISEPGDEGWVERGRKVLSERELSIYRRRSSLHSSCREVVFQVWCGGEDYVCQSV